MFVSTLYGGDVRGFTRHDPLTGVGNGDIERIRVVLLGPLVSPPRTSAEKSSQHHHKTFLLAEAMVMSGDPDSRQIFLKRSGRQGRAAAFAVVVMPPRVSPAPAPPRGFHPLITDYEIVNIEKAGVHETLINAIILCWCHK